jgi:serine/threonine protein kinase/sugar lactone lactonase YvrE
MAAASGDFGPYEIISEIGRGGMGIVYQGRDSRDGKIVAIKQLVLANIDRTKEQEFRDRFRREAATAARLKHPNVVTVYEVCVESRDNFFYVMELLDGRSLRNELAIRGGRLSPKEWWPIFEQAVEGLSFAHSMNVVHRDVKPDNIFILKDGTVKITDFGIARIAEFEQTNLTKTGVMMGTLAYASPEQLQDAKNVDHRADIFSLGVVSYEALSGQIPFTGDGIAQTIVRIVSQEETPLHILVPLVDVHVSSVISKALRKRARDRYRSIKEYSKEYERALEAADDVDTATISPGSLPPLLPNTILRVEPDDREAVSSEDAALAEGVTKLAASQARPVVRLEAAVDAAPLKPVHILDTFGKDQKKLSEPSAICYRSGRLVVADTGTRMLEMFTYDCRWVGQCSMRDGQDSKTKGGSLTKPSGIAMDVRGRIFVCDSSDPYIRIFDIRGVFLKEMCNIQGRESGIQGIALDSTGLLFISDMANGCIQVFQADLGLWMRKIGKKGDGKDEFQLPAGLAIDRLNQVYCADYGSSRIVVFNKNGGFVRSFGGKGTAPGLLNVPRAVAVDGNDRIYVLDSLNHRIQIFGPTGTFLRSFGGRGTEPGKFIGPSDLSLDQENNLLYVADKGNQRVQVFDL